MASNPLLVHPPCLSEATPARPSAVPLSNVCAIVSRVRIVTTTYSKIQSRAEQQWYHQFADLVLRSERTWLGDLLRPRQLMRRERAVNDDGTEREEKITRPNAIDGYHWRSKPVPKPMPAMRLAREVKRLNAGTGAGAPLAADGHRAGALHEHGKEGSLVHESTLSVPCCATWWYRMELLTPASKGGGG